MRRRAGMELGRTFDSAAELYHRARPRYPEAMIGQLVELADLRPDSRVLEIGAGTGIATAALAERGMEIVALEPGPALAEVARRNLAEFDRVRVEIATFEEWEGEPGSFDAVVSATAFHWIDPAVKYAKSARLLKPGGHLAVLDYLHVAGGDDAFFRKIQACYHRFMPGAPAEEPLLAWDMEPDLTELTASGLFEVVEVRQSHELVPYSTAEYIDVLSTYSGHIALTDDLRESLFSCIRGVLDGEFGGSVKKGYRHQVVVARRVG
jgi:SAM-dependent methyltransferase